MQLELGCGDSQGFGVLVPRRNWGVGGSQGFGGLPEVWGVGGSQIWVWVPRRNWGVGASQGFGALVAPRFGCGCLGGVGVQLEVGVWAAPRDLGRWWLLNLGVGGWGVLGCCRWLPGDGVGRIWGADGSPSLSGDI